MRFLKAIFHLLMIIILTLLTQVGGLIYILTLTQVRTKRKRRIKSIGAFSGLYLIATFLVIPYIAPIFGREKIKDSEVLEAHSWFYKLANRNYVKPELNLALKEISRDFNKQHDGVKLIYLDANFPFFDSFPLLPHLSHNDGKKIDITFIYETTNGAPTNSKPSVSGYGVYAKPNTGDFDQPNICLDKGYWQYDFPKYLTFGNINKDIQISKNATRDIIERIVNQNNVGKVFIEPHLKTRLNLKNPKIRFHGCKAVRHDDHIHFQLK